MRHFGDARTESNRNQTIRPWLELRGGKRQGPGYLRKDFHSAPQQPLASGKPSLENAENPASPSPASLSPMQRLARLDNQLQWPETQDANGGTALGRWLLPYADMLTLLLGLFLVLYAGSMQQNRQLQMDIEAMESQQWLMEEAHDAQRETVKNLKSKLITLTQTLEQTLARLQQERQEDPENPKTQQASSAEPVSWVANDTVSVRQDRRGLILSMAEGLLYPPGHAGLLPEAKLALAEVARILKQSKAPIRIEGHTDNSPIRTAQFPSNWELSTARATEILRYLVEAQGIAADRLSAAGYAEFRPLADNSTEQGKQKNRRVDIVIMEGLWGDTDPGAQGKASQDTNSETRNTPKPAALTTASTTTPPAEESPSMAAAEPT